MQMSETTARVWAAMQVAASPSGLVKSTLAEMSRAARASVPEVLFSAGWLVADGKIRLVDGRCDGWRIVQ